MIFVCNVCGAKFLDNKELNIIRNSEKKELDINTNNEINLIFKENFNEATYGIVAKPSPYRQAIENFVRKYFLN